MELEKPIYWTANSKQELLRFPDDIRRQMGYQLGLLQLGIAATDVKPVKGLGKGVTGVYEIRCQDEDGWYRTIYATVVDDVIGVLYCFQKKQNAITNQQMKTIQSRYKAFIDGARANNETEGKK